MRHLLENRITRIIIGLIVFILLVSIGCILWYSVSISRVSKNEEEVKVTIEMGSSTSDIANTLKENNLIKNETAFKLYVKLNKVTDFQAGTYYLKQNMNLKEITEILKTGIMHDPNQISLT